MTKDPKRTRPLDRDGDGKDGGSLPGNRTAPMAETTPAETAAEAETPAEAPPTEATTETETPAEAPPTEAAAETGTPAETTPTEAAAETGTPAETTPTEAAAETETMQAAEADQPPPVGDAITRLAEQDLTAAEIRVQLAQLQLLAGARRLYQSPDGYSATYAAPFVPDDVVQDWIDKGLAVHIPSAGNTGGVRIDQGGRAHIAALRDQLGHVDK